MPLRPRDPSTSAVAFRPSLSSALTASSGITSVVTRTPASRRRARSAAASTTVSAMTCSVDLSSPSARDAPS